MSEQPLPGMPVPPPVRAPQRADGLRTSRYNPKAKRLCDTCVFMIHRYGQGGAAYPKAARWRVSSADKSWYLCEQHKETRL